MSEYITPMPKLSTWEVRGGMLDKVYSAGCHFGHFRVERQWGTDGKWQLSFTTTHDDFDSAEDAMEAAKQHLEDMIDLQAAQMGYTKEP